MDEIGFKTNSCEVKWEDKIVKLEIPTNYVLEDDERETLHEMLDRAITGCGYENKETMG